MLSKYLIVGVYINNLLIIKEIQKEFYQLNRVLTSRCIMIDLRSIIYYL